MSNSAPDMKISQRNAIHLTIPRNLIFVHFGDNQMRGSETCLLNLIKSLTSTDYQIVLWTNHQILAEKAGPHLLECIVEDFAPPFGFGYPAKSKSRFPEIFALVKTARTLIAKHHPALILCNSLAPCQWMVPASLLSGTSLISYHHTTYLPKSRLLSLAYGVSHMLGVSQFTLKDFWQDGFPARSSSVVYNGVEDLSIQSVEKNALRHEFGIGQDEFVITSLSALVPWKKVDLIIDAFRLLSADSGAPAVLLIVGEGPCKNTLQEAAKGLRVIFAGWRTDIANILASSDCLVVAAEKEAFGLTIIEASSMGLPVVAAKAGGPLEIIVDGENGFLAEPGSVQSFATALSTLRNDKVLLNRIGSNARSIYQEKYRKEHMISGIAEIIDKLTGRTGTYRDSVLLRLGRLIYHSMRTAFSRLLPGRR